MRAVAIVLTALVAGQVAAQEYMPYPGARITSDQWQQYFYEVSSKHAASRREFPAEHLVVFEDRATYTAYAFTQPGHAAHPSWRSEEHTSELQSHSDLVCRLLLEKKKKKKSKRLRNKASI